MNIKSNIYRRSLKIKPKNFQRKKKEETHTVDLNKLDEI